MKKYSKSSALATARRAVSSPTGAGSSWQIYHPYDRTADGLSGPSICSSASSYAAATKIRAQIVASLVTSLMGICTDDTEYAIYSEAWDTTIDGLVHAAIAASAV